MSDGGVGGMHDGKSDTRELILKTAAAAFAAHGYHHASVGGIAAAAGVTKPTVYYHFGSKAGLFQALLDRAVDQVYELLNAELRRAASCRERLEGLLKSVFHFARENPDLIRVSFMAAFAAREELPAEVHHLRKSARNFEVLHSIIREGQAGGELAASDSWELAMALQGQLFVHVLGRLADPALPLDDRVAEAVVELYFRGAGP